MVLRLWTNPSIAWRVSLRVFSSACETHAESSFSDSLAPSFERAAESFLSAAFLGSMESSAENAAFLSFSASGGSAPASARQNATPSHTCLTNDFRTPGARKKSRAGIDWPPCCSFWFV